MEDTSDDFFNDFSTPPTKTASQLSAKPTSTATTTTTSTTSRQPPPPRASTSTSTNPMTRTTASTSTAARSAYHTTTSASTSAARTNPPPPPQRTTDIANGTSTRAAAGSTGAAVPLRASSSSRPTNSYYASKATKTAAASNAPAVPSNNPYITSVSAPAAQPSYYSSTPIAPYNYGAASAVATSTAPAPTATPAATSHHPAPVPQIMNPYMLSNHHPAPAPDQFLATTSGFSGTMDTAGFTGTMDSNNSTTATTFLPNHGGTGSAPLSGGYMGYDPSQFQDEPPLLEELGINVEHIFGKMRSVALPFQRFGGNMDATVIQDADLAGPIALVLLLGAELMFSGKLQFGYIYGFGLFGCISMTLVLNFMSPTDAISFWTVTSILGYSLLPVNLLAAVKLVVVNLGNLTTMGRILGVITVLWCTVSSTRLMEQGCDMRNQRYLIAYPIGLLYTAFVMITIF